MSAAMLLQAANELRATVRGCNADPALVSDADFKLAVADLLAAAAVRAETKIQHGGRETAVWSHEQHAVKVARAVLGVDA